MKEFLKPLSLLLAGLVLSSPVLSATHTVDLTMRYETVTLGKKPVKAVTVNGQIPAPELRFTEGDEVTINLHNELDEPGSIHWHGLLVPYKMDGVPWVTMAPVMPGETFQYHFTLKQSGTYWYHSHSKFHEQRGLYGAFVVEPKQEPLKYDREVTLMLSDWADRNPDETYSNLKKDGDYYKQFRPSWKFFWDEYRDADETKRQQIRQTIAHMQQMRMGVWDWGDVAYDAFLINGKTPDQPWTQQVKPGETVRLRIINGGASSYFNLRIDGAEYFTVVAADGQPVEPVMAQRLLMGMAETYDILLKIDEDKPYYVYAEAQDRTGHAIATLKTRPDQPDTADLAAFNDPWFDKGHDHHAMNGSQPQTMAEMDHSTHMAMDHSQHMGHDMAAMSSHTSSPKKVVKLDYNDLRATYVSRHPEEPATELTLHLTGNMERYIWSFDNVRFEDAEPILFEEGKTYKLTLINDTMMHHPIHIHGHWFVLDTGNGSHNPRKHTIDVPPMGQRVAWIKAEESGKWLFHCHNLYHMKAGMTRLIRYDNLPEEDHH
ncbi:MAG: multicopper oxidase domain-containing protein [Porticoccaceae bacterium]